MELMHIKDKTCPSCGSRCISESQKDRHSNGEWNESREYECHCVLRYSPNFSSTIVVRECPNKPSEKEKNQLREIAKNKVINFIKALNVDDEYKNLLLNELRYK